MSADNVINFNKKTSHSTHAGTRYHYEFEIYSDLDDGTPWVRIKNHADPAVPIDMEDVTRKMEIALDCAHHDRFKESNDQQHKLNAIAYIFSGGTTRVYSVSEDEYSTFEQRMWLRRRLADIFGLLTHPPGARLEARHAKWWEGPIGWLVDWFNMRRNAP